MANTSRPFGARPTKHLNGSPYNGQFNIYEIGASDATNTFIGDLVKYSTQASTDVYGVCERAGTSGEVTTGLLLGAIIGFVPDFTNLNTPQYRAASTKRLAMVADATDIIFTIQDGATVVTPLASIGLNTGFQATAGSTTTGLSNMTTGATAATTTNALPLKIVGIVNSPDNQSAAAFQKLLVLINQHYFMGGQTAT